MKFKVKSVCFLSLSMLMGLNSTMFVQATSEISKEETTVGLNDTEDTYEYTSVDEYGNVNIVRLPQVDSEKIKEEQIVDAQSFDLVLQIGNSEEVIDNFDTYEDAENAQKARAKARSVGTTSISPRVDYSNIKNGIVNFHTKPSTQNTSFTVEATGKSGYLNGAYAGDGAFLGYCDTAKSKVRFKQAGVVGCVAASDVRVINTDVPENISVSYYRASDGILKHTILAGSSYSSVINVGPMQSYMQNNTSYYSYDGHYFYTDFNAMIADYKANVYTRSINPTQPYYNYYQYLTHRTKTSYTASQLDSFINANTKSNSKLRGMGQYLVDNQNIYGSNAVLMLATAANESAWGVSSIALNKNNLFGHNAVDATPGLSADTYASPQASVENHAKYYISRDYLDPKDVSGLYNGGHLGDKASGMNVKYASDSYWGEKAASIAYTIDNYLGKKDFAKYEIGIKTSSDNVNVRADASTSSNMLYQTTNTLEYPVVILGEKSGTSVSGNNVWYKIQSDPTISEDRSGMTQDVCVYNFANAYGYISSGYIKPVKYTNVESGERPGENVNIISALGLKNEGGYLSGFTLGSDVSSFIASVKKADSKASVTVKNANGAAITSGTIATGMSVVINQNGSVGNYTIVIYGDSNGDGKIMSNDYVVIKNHIMDIQKLNGVKLKAADVNRDGKIMSNDYVLIRNHIMGVADIKQ